MSRQKELDADPKAIKQRIWWKIKNPDTAIVANESSVCLNSFRRKSKNKIKIFQVSVTVL